MATQYYSIPCCLVYYPCNKIVSIIILKYKLQLYIIYQGISCWTQFNEDSLLYRIHTLQCCTQNLVSVLHLGQCLLCGSKSFPCHRSHHCSARQQGNLQNIAPGITLLPLSSWKECQRLCTRGSLPNINTPDSTGWPMAVNGLDGFGEHLGRLMTLDYLLHWAEM